MGFIFWLVSHSLDTIRSTWHVYFASEALLENRKRCVAFADEVPPLLC